MHLAQAAVVFAYHAILRHHGRMEKDTGYGRTHFKAAVLEEAIAVMHSICGKRELIYPYMKLTKGRSTWSFTDFHEFVGEYREPHKHSSVTIRTEDSSYVLDLYYEDGARTRVSVKAPSRGEVQKIAGVFDKHAADSLVPEAPIEVPQLVVFLGHGRDQQWRDLKDHLHEVHGYEVAAYEVGARAGHVIRDILEEMLEKSSFAILVMTGEDETSDGKLRARQNVIHETGLFQGKLGFSRAIVLVEEGVEDYSNLQGIQGVRFSKGNIRETYGEVLGTLRREFPVST
jgi:Predicted nucleotide-binding protein containing TIR -like domain